MSNTLKIVLAFLMVLALFFGFLSLFVPSDYNFERLHIFLFNLVAGGTIVILYTEGRKHLSLISASFFIISIAFAVAAFFEIYPFSMTVALVLAGIVEFLRWKRFSVFPIDFFKKDVPIYEKFHQASLLCLSMGLVISTLVTLNNEYLKLVTMPKLKLDTFFLGFSFPLSLITFSVIFRLMKEGVDDTTRKMKEFGFWSVNLGVVIFFLFIIFEKIVPQIFVTTILFLTVIMILIIYSRHGNRLQQKNFLTSGIGFLLVTAVTGIAYILLALTPTYSSEEYKWLIRLHAFASLYGWNFCGLAVILRFDDFPIKLHSTKIILFHWVTVLLFAPLGDFFRFFSIVAILSYAAILWAVLFSRSDHKYL